MKTSMLLALSLSLMFAACTSAPTETRDTTEDAVKETPAPASALGPISLYFGDTLAASVDTDGRFLAGSEASEPGRHVATFSGDGVLSFVDKPDVMMTLGDDGTITMSRGDGQTMPVPITIASDGTIALLEGNMADTTLAFDSNGVLTSTKPLPPNLVGTRIDGFEKVSPRHAAYVFVVTSMFTVSPSKPESPSAPAEEPAVAP